MRITDYTHFRRICLSNWTKENPIFYAGYMFLACTEKQINRLANDAVDRGLAEICKDSRGEYIATPSGLRIYLNSRNAG